MKIALAQTRPMKGDICGNIENHKRLIEIAAGQGAEMIVFPELSLTGYEPELAGKLAMDQDDHRFDEFQKISDSRQIIIAAGAPTRNGRRPCISLLIFQPGQGRQTYSKQYLHADEEPFFSKGEHHQGIIAAGSRKIALAICYELSVPAHAKTACQLGAGIYIASVAKTAKGVAGASERLVETPGDTRWPRSWPIAPVFAAATIVLVEARRGAATARSWSNCLSKAKERW